MIELLIPARRRDLGGFEVGRVLPYPQRRMVGPFVFFDHMGPADWAAGFPRDRDVRPHPHIGLSTVTYLLEGEITHRDSVGVTQDIRPGAVNWMTAGSGITHSERFDGLRASGGRLHGLQAWVALPDGQEEIAPAFSHHPADTLPVFEEKGLKGRVIAGTVYGLRAPTPVHSPLFYIHLDLDAGASAGLPSGHAERALYVVTGAVTLGTQRVEAGHMAVFPPGAEDHFEALEKSTVVLLGGEPVGERHIFWNFVSSSKERIEMAKADWRAGRFVLPTADDGEFIPLPEG
jgi:redox-sensitive bicupin YhaK (pirin superfamily)